MHGGADLTERRDRLERARGAAEQAGLAALLITPGPDLRYLVGYDAVPLERLTCLVVRSSGDPVLVVPALEEAAALASPAGDLELEVRTWRETEDPFALVASMMPAAGAIGLDDRMWAEKVLHLRAAMPDLTQRLAGEVLRPMRMRKTPGEIASLVAAGAAIDRVHAEVPHLLRAGRTEREVARDLADLIIAVGHTRVDFVIVASGPNGASPHHEVSDRVIAHGDVVVVDIGGTMPDGYCSDSTRTYAVADVPRDTLASYEVLEAAQEAAVAWVRPGVTAESVDHAAREVIAAAGFGDLFIHRTGHGIGLETHEDPYIVDGNRQVIEPGMAFSIEPGIYQRGLRGARIEDIVVCTHDGAQRVNHQPRSLVIAGG